MASLPAKPQGSSRDAPTRFQDERDRRTRHPPHHTDDRPFSRRWASSSGGDSYAPTYDPRRDAGFYSRRDIDNRTRRSWDRQPDFDARFRRGPSDYDRDHREYERRYISNPRYRDPSGRRDGSRWRSRSPSRRDRSRSRSPYIHKRVKLGNHSVDTSPRRSSPHRPSMYSRSRSRDASQRLRSRSPRPEPAAFSNPVKPEGVILDPVMSQDTGTLQTTPTHDLEVSHQDKSLGVAPSPQYLPLFKKEEEEDVKIPVDEEVKPKTYQTSPVTKDEPPKSLTSGLADRHPTRPRSPALLTQLQVSAEQKHILHSHVREPLSDQQTKEQWKMEEEKSLLVPSRPRARSPSPPRQPRQRGPPGPPPSYPRHRSRSPPKGPRNHPNVHSRGHTTPTGPASSHPPGPRGQRQSFAPPNSFSNSLSQPPTPQTQSPITPSVSAPIEDIKHTTAQVSEVVKVPLPTIPVKQLPPSLTGHLDKEISRLQSQRAHLATDYTNLAKEVRRALHELDMATIDLHAAELRRKVADAQHEKARNGLLGIDYLPTVETKTST